MAAIIPLRSSSLVIQASGTTSTGTAGTAIGGQRVVKKDSLALVQYASSTDILDVGQVLGLSLTAASAGNLVSILREGETEDPSWNWTLNYPIFLSSNGLMTQVVPVKGIAEFSQIVAFPITATRMMFSLREPVIL